MKDKHENKLYTGIDSPKREPGIDESIFVLSKISKSQFVSSNTVPSFLKFLFSFSRRWFTYGMYRLEGFFFTFLDLYHNVQQSIDFFFHFWRTVTIRCIQYTIRDILRYPRLIKKKKKVGSKKNHSNCRLFCRQETFQQRLTTAHYLQN